jgi:hypothetical protein
VANDVLLDRDWKIVYGSVTIGGVASGTDYHLFRKHELDISYPVAVVEFDVLVTAATDAEYDSRVTALVAEFRTPRQKLEIILGSQTIYTYDPGAATNTGFDARPSISKPESEFDTARSVLFRCRVEVDLPADLSGQAGRREASVKLRTLDSGKRQVEFVGVYTALSTALARAQYEAQIDTYCDGINTGIDGTATWAQLDTEEAEANDTNKVLSYRRLYEEVIYDESNSATNDTALIGPLLQIEVGEVAAPGGAADSSTRPGREITLAYRVAVDKDTDLKTKWDSTIRPYLIEEMRNLAGGSIVLLNLTPRYDPTNNRLTAMARARCYSGTSRVMYRDEVHDYLSLGKRLIPLADGLEHTYRKYLGPKRHVRILNRVSLVTGGGRASGGVFNPLSQPSMPGHPAQALGSNPVTELPFAEGEGAEVRQTSFEIPPGFELIDETVSTYPHFEGVPGYQIEMEFVSETATLLRAEVVE